MSHKVKTHKWSGGHLTTKEFEFNSVDECMAFLDTPEAMFSHGIKVYNDAGELIHALNPEVETNLDPNTGYN
jgi:hypothetical protein